MVLGGQPPGRVGRRPCASRSRPYRGGFACFARGASTSGAINRRRTIARAQAPARLPRRLPRPSAAVRSPIPALTPSNAPAFPRDSVARSERRRRSSAAPTPSSYGNCRRLGRRQMHARDSAPAVYPSPKVRSTFGESERNEAVTRREASRARRDRACAGAGRGRLPEDVSRTGPPGLPRRTG